MMVRFGFIFLLLLQGILLFNCLAFADSGIPTKVLVHVVSRDAKVIGSGVGGAAVRIIDAATGKTLATGVQRGGTGDTERIMTEPRKRGDVIYGTPGAAFFLAEIKLDRPTQVDIRVEAPLAYPQAIQRGSKTVTLIPGRHIDGDGVIIELDGLIVDILEPAANSTLGGAAEIQVRAEVRML